MRASIKQLSRINLQVLGGITRASKRSWMDAPSVQVVTGFTSALEWCSPHRSWHKPTAVSRVFSNDAAACCIGLWAGYLFGQKCQSRWELLWFSPNRCWPVSLDEFLVISIVQHLFPVSCSSLSELELRRYNTDMTKAVKNFAEMRNKLWCSSTGMEVQTACPLVLCCHKDSSQPQRDHGSFFCCVYMDWFLRKKILRTVRPTSP